MAFEEIDVLSSSRGLKFIKHKGANPEDFFSRLADMNRPMAAGRRVVQENAGC